METATQLAQLNRIWLDVMAQWRVNQSHAILRSAGDAAVRVISRACPQLAVLDISGCTRITTTTLLAAINRWPLLRQLVAVGCTDLQQIYVPDCCCCSANRGINLIRKSRSNLDVISRYSSKKQYNANTTSNRNVVWASPVNPIILLKVKDQQGSEVQFKIETTTPLRKLMDAYCSRLGLQTSEVRFMMDGKRITPAETSESLRLEDGHLLDVALEQTNVGQWQESPASATKLSELESLLLGFVTPNAVHADTVEAIMQVAENLCIPPRTKEAFICWKTILKPSQCMALINWVDQAYVHRAENNLDFQLEVSHAQLNNLVGSGTVDVLISCARAVLGDTETLAPYLVLRRRAVKVGGQERIPFHRDYSSAVVNVALNSDFEGGRLMFVLHGRIVSFDRSAGCATAHNDSVVHAVSRLTSGIRYNLLAAFDPKDESYAGI